MVVNKFLFQDGTDIKSYVFADIGRISPLVEDSSDTSMDEFFETSNSSLVGMRNLFDGKFGSGVTFSRESSASVLWFTINLQEKKVIKSYKITSSNFFNLNLAPTSWRVMGSNDNASWVEIDSRTNQTNWTQGETKEYFVDNQNAYQYYKIEFNKNNGNTNHSIAMSEIQLNGLRLGLKTIGTAPVTKEMFDTQGMTDLSNITNDVLQQLVSDTPKLLCWTDEENPNRMITEYGNTLNWSTVSSTLPTSTQFLEHGMDDLSVLNRQVTELPTMQMEDKTNILFTNGEVGKVFSKTIDLKKYFDIRSLKVEGK